MKSINTFRMAAQTVMAIDAFEKANFTKPSKIWERLVNILPNTGEVSLDFIMASSLDKTISVIFTHNGHQDCRNLPIVEKGSLGNLLFLHCITTAVTSAALEEQYGFDYAYYVGQRVAAGIVAGDQETYPEYVVRLLPNHYQEKEDYEFSAFRFIFVGENRDEENTVSRRVAVKCMVQPTSRDMSNNINEVFPVMQVGPYIAFNCYVPFPCNIISPYDNECVLPIAKEMGLTAEECVELIDEKRITISAKNGMATPSAMGIAGTLGLGSEEESGKWNSFNPTAK